MPFLCIDLKSFYASVECALRGLDPFTTNLVVADKERGGGSIVLAATPCIKAHGAKSRCRIYELPKNVYPIYAKPRMNKYIEYSAMVYKIYLRFVSKEDIHVYSIDEAFLDLTSYLKYYNCSIFEIAKKIIDTIFKETKITATAGIGDNMFLAKVALDIIAKHEKDNIGYLNQELFQKRIWNHKPITDSWGNGHEMAKRLYHMGIDTIGQIAKGKKERFIDLFGVMGEELYNHSHGIDNSSIQGIKDYVPSSKSLGNGQVLFEDYNCHDAYIILEEMVYRLVLDLHTKKLTTNSISLFIGYSKDYEGSFCKQTRLLYQTSSFKLIMQEFKYLYWENIINNPIRNLSVRAGGLKEDGYLAFDLFNDSDSLLKERNLYRAIVEIRERFGKNAINKAISLDEKATLIKRNGLIGGHNAS